MAEQNMPRLEDIASVGTRIRWGTILAGAMMALALYYLLTTLGAAVGLSISDRVSASTLGTGAIIWAFVTTLAAVFLGGVVTSVFTVGENKTEAALYGLIMWALLVTGFLVLGASGVRSGLSALVGLADRANSRHWEAAAREAGVTTAQIEEWRKTASDAAKAAQDPQQQQEMRDAATKASWYAFAGFWLSMLAAAAGGLVGAGPTFRLVAGPLGAGGRARFNNP